jgi:glycopeptide antibiotics resistance protein
MADGSTERTLVEPGAPALPPQPPKSRARVGLAVTASVAYGLVVAFATLTPTPLDRGYRTSIERLLAVMHRHGVPDWFGYDALESSANVAMFVPVGFLVAMLLPRRRWWMALLACPALSAGIEASQAAFLSERFATIADVMANSLGALLGIAVSCAIRAAVHRRDEKVVARAAWARDAEAA